MDVVHVLTNVAILFLVVLLVNLSTSIYMSYSNPHVPFIKTPTFNISLALLECAERKMPLVPWYKIEKCVRNIELYHVSNGHVPYTRVRGSVPTAYVMKNMVPRSFYAQKSVFATTLYKRLDIVSQALVIVHECAHLALEVDDIAYYWQEHFKHLTPEEHLDNADSYMYEMAVHCIDRGTMTIE